NLVSGRLNPGRIVLLLEDEDDFVRVGGVRHAGAHRDCGQCEGKSLGEHGLSRVDQIEMPTGTVPSASHYFNSGSALPFQYPLSGTPSLLKSSSSASVNDSACPS